MVFGFLFHITVLFYGQQSDLDLSAAVFCPDRGHGFRQVVGKRCGPERQFYSL